MKSQMEGERFGESLKRRPLERADSDDMNSSPLKRPNMGEEVNMREPEDVSEVPSSLRFLLSNSAAGAIIGKGGSVIQEFQAQAGATIHLSRTREFFPGTNERIIVLTGTVSAILTALHLILSKIRAEDAKALSEGSGNSIHDEDPPSKGQIRLVVPNSVCGAVIGKAGGTIKSFMEDSGAAIKLSSQEASPPGITDRLVTVAGTLEQQLRAVALVLTKISEEPMYAQYGTAPLAYKVLAGGPMPVGSRQMTSAPQPAPRGKVHVEPGYSWEPARYQVMQTGLATTTVTVAVPDEHVGAVVGKGGVTMNEIMRVAGVTIKLSDRGDFVEGTTNRKLTISGGTDAVLAAQHLISQKVKDNAALLTRSLQPREPMYERVRPRFVEPERAPLYRRERDRDLERDREPVPRERDWERERLRDADRYREYERNGSRSREEDRYLDRDRERGDGDREYKERAYRPIDRR